MNNILRRPFRYSYNGAVFWIIGINVLIFFSTRFMDRRSLMLFFYNMAMVPELIIKEGRLWTFITYMFMHDINGITHILFNMIGLFIFGSHVEKQMGSKEFVLYYLLTGALAGVLSFFIYYFSGQYLVSLVGASGALYAVMIACAIFFPDSIVYIWGIIPLRMPIMVIGYTAIAIFSQVSGRGGNVAHITHLGGFIFGWIYFMVRYGINPWNRLFGRRY